MRKLSLIRRAASSAAASLLALAGCEAAPETARDASLGDPLPARVCEEVRSALEKLKESSPFVFTDEGEATLENELWLSLPSASREELARSLALHASCQAGASSKEQRVLVRGPEGNLMAERTIDTTANLLLEE